MAKIMIVDDSKLIRALIKSIIEGLGHETVGECVNGEDGFLKYLALRPDIVTMDVTMPVLDGIGAVKKIKAADPNAKIIMITSNAQRSRLSQAYECGVEAYISKPIKPAELISAINKIINT